jgi:hypothetical protein
MIDADPLSPDMNAYCDVAFADAYFTFRFGGEAWLDFDEAKKEALLVRASNTLDTFTYGGYKKSGSQPMKWPRSGLVDDEGYSINDTTVPRQVKQAACEFAYWMWTEEERFMSDTDLRQLEGYKAGPLDVKAKKHADIYPAIALDMLRSMGSGFLLATGDDGSAKNSRIYL